MTTSPGNVNIYSWLPFTQQDLADAAAVTVKFCVDYNTYTYTENAAAYVATMSGLITGQLATTLQASYATPGVAPLRTSQKQVSTGTAAINSLRAFGASSLTFIVNTGQRLVSSRGTTHGTAQYAVTVTGSGSSWQVDDIELSNAGNYMTNRLLIRSETKQPMATGNDRAPRILVFGVIGLVGILGLGLLTVPIMIGTNIFFAATAGCSGQQTGTTGQPAGSAKAKSIPADYLYWYKKVGQSVRRALDDPGRDRDGGKRQRPDHAARRAQRVERLRRGRADADRHRRRGHECLGRPAGPPGQPGGQRDRDR